MYVGEYLDDFEAAAAAGTVSEWVYVGNQPVNVYMYCETPIALSATVNLDATADPNNPDLYKSVASALTVNSYTANYQANLCVPWVRLNMTVRASGQIDKAWIFARPQGK